MVGVLMVFAAACGDVVDDGDHRVRGSGVTITESRELDAFDGVVLAGEGRVRFAEGVDGRIEIETDDDLVDLIETRIADGTLTISTRSDVDIDPTDGVVYRLGCPDLTRVALTGAGDIDLAGCTTTDRLSLELAGAGDVTAPDIDVSELQVALPGAGQITTTGATDLLDVVIAGVGDLDAADLRAAEASVDSTGVGSVTVWATDRLDLRLTGVGTVRYHGEPEVSSTVTGIGSIEALGPK